VRALLNCKSDSKKTERCKNWVFMHSAKTISIKEIEQIYFFELTCFCGKFRLVVLINNDAIVTHFENKKWTSRDKCRDIWGSH
jgi:hypothetical protein